MATTINDHSQSTAAQNARHQLTRIESIYSDLIAAAKAKIAVAEETGHWVGELNAAADLVGRAIATLAGSDRYPGEAVIHDGKPAFVYEILPKGKLRIKYPPTDRKAVVDASAVEPRR